MMFLPMVFMMMAGLGIIWLWEEEKRDEASARYQEEMEQIRAGKCAERKVIHGSYSKKRKYYYNARGRHRKCC